MRKRWIFDQIWYGRDMAWGLACAWCEVLAVGTQVEAAATLTISLRKATPRHSAHRKIPPAVIFNSLTIVILLGPDSSGR